MLEYIKIAIASFIGGIFSPLPASSSAHFSFLNYITNLSSDETQVGFYFSVVSLVASVVMLLYVRKIYARAMSVVIKNKKSKKVKSYKTMIVNTLISLIAAVIMFVPYSKTNLLMDIYNTNLGSNNILISAFCCFASGFILIIAIWYAKQKNEKKHRAASKSDALRFTLYQIPANFLPGFSHIANGATSLVVSNVDENVIMRELYLYAAPSMFVISAARLISYIVRGVTIDYIAIAVCAVFAVIGSAIMFPLISRVNVRKTFTFFAVYSIIFGLFMITASFVI
ncbi:MAG: hypothetical protein NC122_08450 [Faecalibacterium sp.]|nr:hypothetical protein [Ruminococcus sp.]MCM1392761.1 hypothetical protein [Ruminococcus sp.]MCM1486224.1 hypothetical protein [Faecalibacterium sp.]